VLEGHQILDYWRLPLTGVCACFHVSRLRDPYLGRLYDGLAHQVVVNLVGSRRSLGVVQVVIPSTASESG